MDDLYICQKLLKVMKEREESLHEILCYGAVKDFQELRSTGINDPARKSRNTK